MDPLELLKMVRAEREHAERELAAWQACVDGLLRLIGGSLTGHTLLNFCRTQWDDQERQGWYRAADVYRRVIDALI